MSKRLQVIFDDAEYRDLQKTARRARMTVSAWVRQCLRVLRRPEAVIGVESKLQVVREATRHANPAPATEIGRMLEEIERGSIDRSGVVRSSGGKVSVVTVSPKYQVVIPRHIRESLGLAPGQKVQVFEYDGRVEFIPVRPAKSFRGFLPGLSTTVPRERDRV